MSGARSATKAVNVSIPEDLLEAARAYDINLSATLTASLENRLRQHRREEWLAQNAKGIDAYNRDVDVHGGFGDTLRSFWCRSLPCTRTRTRPPEGAFRS